MRRALAGITFAFLAAVPALAAEPESGAVSTASPSVQWTGVSSGGFVTTFSQIFINTAGQKTPCQAPSCDTFTLDVKDSADLNVEVTSEATITYLQIEKPDGEIVYNNGIEPEGTEPDYTTKIRIKKAPAGTYKVQSAVNSTAEEAYSGKAALAVAAPAAPPAQPGSPPPATAPPSSPSPSSAPAPATVSVKAGKLSARKLAKRRRLPLTLSASGPVTGVKIVLAAKGKAVAVGKLAELEGTKKFQLKLKKKLKPGRYDLAVEGKDANGNTVGVKTTVKIRR
jgi:hypothetical protein